MLAPAPCLCARNPCLDKVEFWGTAGRVRADLFRSASWMIQAKVIVLVLQIPSKDFLNFKQVTVCVSSPTLILNAIVHCCAVNLELAPPDHSWTDVCCCFTSLLRLDHSGCPGASTCAAAPPHHTSSCVRLSGNTVVLVYSDFCSFFCELLYNSMFF